MAHQHRSAAQATPEVSAPVVAPEPEHDEDLGNEAMQEKLKRLRAGGGGDGPTDPIDAAAGAPTDPLPFLDVLEARFGVPLDHVRAHLGHPDIRAVGANAAAVDQHVIFAEASPSLETVAEEVGHTLQTGSGSGYSSAAAGSEARAGAAAKAVAQGHDVDPGSLGAKDGAIQRAWWNPLSWGADNDTATFTWDAAPKDVAAEPAVEPKLVTPWFGTMYVYERAEDLPTPATPGGTPLYRGVPAVTADNLALQTAEAEAELACVRDQIVGALDAADGVASVASVEVGIVMERLVEDPACLALLPHLHGDSAIFGHETMVAVQKALPGRLLQFSAALDPVEQLKAALRGATSKEAILAEIQGWAQRFPDHCERALTDAEVIETIARDRLAEEEAEADAATEGATAVVTGVTFAAMNPSVLANAVAFDLMGMGSLWDQIIHSEDGQQIAALQLLADKGVVDEGDPGVRMERALADSDEATFMEAWHEVVRKPEVFARYADDPVFVLDVEAKLSARVVTQVRAALKAGPVVQGEPGQGGLSDHEREQVTILSQPTLKVLTDQFDDDGWYNVASYFNDGASDSAVMSALDRWGAEMRAVLAVDGVVPLDKQWDAQALLRGLFEDSRGTELSAEIARGLSEANAKRAMAIIGDPREVRSSSVAATEDAARATAGGFQTELFGSELDAVLAAADEAAAQLRVEIEVNYWHHDSEILGFLDTFTVAVEDAVQPQAALGEDGVVTNADDPRAIWACEQRRLHARRILRERYATLTGADLDARLACALQGESEVRGTSILAAADAEATPMPDAPGAYSETITRAEDARVQEVVLRSVSALYARLGTFKHGVTVDEQGVLDELIRCEAAVRHALKPAAVTPEALPLWEAKVRVGLDRIRDAYDAQHGSITNDLADHVWDTGIRRRCQLILGARDVPAGDTVTAMVAGVEDPAQMELANTQLRVLRDEALQLAYALDDVLGKLGDADIVGELDRLSADFEAGVAGGGPWAGLGADAALANLEAQVPGFSRGGTPLALLEECYRSIGGDLAHNICKALAGSDDADRILRRFGYPGVAGVTVDEDPEMAAAVAALDEEAADTDLSEDELRTLQHARAELRRHIESKQVATVKSRSLFTALEAYDLNAPTEDDSQRAAKEAAKAAVFACAKELAQVTGAFEPPMALIPAADRKPGDPPLVEDPMRYLALETYRETTGVTLSVHAGLRLAGDDVLALAKELRFPLSGERRTMNSARAEAALSANWDVLRRDADEGFGPAEAVAKAEQLHAYIEGLLAASDGGLSTLGTIGSIVGMPWTGPALYKGWSHADRQRKEAELFVYIGRLGSPAMIEVIREAFALRYGVPLEFCIRQIFGIESDTAAVVIDNLDSTADTFSDGIRTLAVGGQIDEIYATMMGASDAEHAELLADPEALAAVRGLGREVYDRVYRTAKGDLSLADMFRTRDADSDEYGEGAWGSVTEAYYKTKAAWGYDTDEEGMKKDIGLFLGVLKEKISTAKNTYTVLKGDCLWDIAEKLTGDPRRWPEMYAINEDVVVSNDPNLIYPDDKFRIPPSWITGLTSEGFRKQCREMINDPELMAILKNELSGDDLLEMRLLIAEGGELSGRSQVLVDLEGLGTANAIIDHLKALKDDERKAALADASFMSKLAQDLEGDELKKALAILGGSKATDGMRDAMAQTEGWKSVAGIDVVDEKAIFDGIGSLDADGLKALAADPVMLAKLQLTLDATEDEQGLLNDVMDQVRANLTAPPDVDPETPDGKEKLALHAIQQKREFLRIKHGLAIRAACAGGADGLLAAAQAVFAEKGEMKDPRGDGERNLFVFNSQDRNRVWAQVQPALKPWRDQVVGAESELLEFAMNVFDVTNGAPSIVKALQLRIDDAMAEDAPTRTYADVVHDAVMGDADPAGARIGMALKWFNDKDKVLAAIGAAGSDLVIREWSNIERAGANGSLREKFQRYMLARQEWQELKGRKGVSADDLAAAEDECHTRHAYYRNFQLSYSSRVDELLDDGEGITGSTAAEVKDYRAAVIRRICAITPQELAVHFGLAEWETYETGLEDADGNKQRVRSGEITAHDTVDLGRQRIDIQEGDIAELMSVGRKARAERGIAEAEVDHQVGEGSESVVDYFSDGKSTIGLASMDFRKEHRLAEARKDGEDVGLITAEEAEGLEAKLAVLNKSIGDYKAAKTTLADAMKAVVAAVAMALTALVSGPAGPSFIAALMISAGTAGANMIIDSSVQGNDFDLYREGLPGAVKDIGTDMLTFGLTRGMANLTARFPKTVGGVKNFRDGFSRVGHTVKDAFGEWGVPGEIAKTVFLDGFVKPTWNAAVDPLMHLMDPSALKYGWTSATNEAIQQWSSNASTLGDDVIAESWKAFVAGSGKALTKHLQGKVVAGKPTKVPGVKTGKEPPDIESFWGAVKKSAADNLTPEKMLDHYQKKAVAWFVKQGTLVLEADKLGEAFDPALADLDAIEGKLEGLLTPADYGVLIASLGKTHVEAFLKGVNDEYGKVLENRRTEAKLKADKTKLEAAGRAAGLDATERAVAEKHYKQFISTTQGFMTSDDVTPEQFYAEYWPELNRKLDEGKKAVPAAHEDAYVQWVLSDPKKSMERALKGDRFRKNIGNAETFSAAQVAAAAKLPDEQKRWAEQMHAKGIHGMYDVVKDEGSVPDLTTTDGKKAFEEAYVSMKAVAIADAGPYTKASEKKAFEAFLKEQPASFYALMDFLLPKEQPNAAAILMAKQAFEADKNP